MSDPAATHGPFVTHGTAAWSDTDASGRYPFTAPLRWAEDAVGVRRGDPYWRARNSLTQTVVSPGWPLACC
jgi:hypothetical protein